MQAHSAGASQFSEVRERASQRILMASALVAGIAGVISSAATLLVVAVPGSSTDTASASSARSGVLRHDSGVLRQVRAGRSRAGGSAAPVSTIQS